MKTIICSLLTYLMVMGHLIAAPLSKDRLKDGVVYTCSFDNNDSTEGMIRSSTVTSYGVDGIVGGAYKFNGKNYIRVPKFSQPVETGEISLAMWVKPSLTLKKGSTRNQFTSDGWGPHQFQYERGTILLELYDKDHKISIYRHPITLEAGKWYHLGFTAKLGHQVRLFVNGLKFQMKEKAPETFKKQKNSKSKRLNIGVEEYIRWHFHGTMDELTIWDTVIPPGKMKKLYDRQRAGKK